MDEREKFTACRAGLTGGIASGKTAVGNIFLQLGADIIDADILSRKVVEKGSEGEAKLRDAFPDAYSDGFLDRLKLRKLVFGNSSAREKLDSVMHPLIAFEAQKAMLASKNRVVILVAPLLFETGLNKGLYPVIAVSCDADVRIKRLMQRDAISESLARQMIAAQLTDEQREQRADIVIRNDGDIENLRRIAERIYQKLLERSEQKSLDGQK